MNRSRSYLALGAVLLLSATSLAAAPPAKPRLRYVPEQKDPVIAEMEEANRRAEADRQAETRRIREAQAEVKKPGGGPKELRFDFTDVALPASVEAFESAFHFPPVGQFNTGNCWSFSTTSFFESEVHRLTGRKIKLSEMYTVYYEYLEKARRFIQQRGDSYFDVGSEGNAVILVWRKHGIVPAVDYRGTKLDEGRHDDHDLVASMKAYMAHARTSNLSDEDIVIASLRLILDKHIGRPPERITYDGVVMTPPQFLADVLKLKLDDYVAVMSTLSQPFHAYGEYEVAANWWHSQDYYNVPLDQFYAIIRHAIRNGYTVKLNGDITESGHDGTRDAAIIPPFDIPREAIDQDARELRIFTEDTVDDHDMHLVGHTRVGDDDWYLVKDSYDAMSLGRFPGYMFYRDDYIRLKTLTFIVHKDVVAAVVKEFANSE